VKRPNQSISCSDGISSMVVVASSKVVGLIRDNGGLLFVWPHRSRGPRCSLTVLRASLAPPSRALEFRRIVLPHFLLFLHPDLRTLPRELWLEGRGSRVPHVSAYWNGVAYVG
jgi:hypothetical protein